MQLKPVKQEVFPISQYIPFTEEQKLRAGDVDLEEFLRLRGERLIRSGHDKRLDSDHSVTVRGNSWYDHAAERGGGPVSFLQRFYRMSYPEAMQTLLGGNSGLSYPAAPQREPEPHKEFALPERSGDMRRVYAYLIKQRGIDKDVITHFAKAGLLYEDARHHNCVFVGTDEQGVPRHAHKRSTNSYGEAFRINVEGSDPRCSFHHIGRDGSLFVFEAPIDMMSYITMHPDRWQEHSYVACYLGDERYPRVIGEKDFLAVQMLRSGKNTYAPCKVGDEIRAKAVCGRCGAKLNRAVKNRKTARWECENPDCGHMAHISDERLVAAVNALLDELAHTPEILTKRVPQEPAPSGSVQRVANELTNALNRGTESVEYLRTLVFACAAEKYSELPDSSLQYKVDKLRERIRAGDTDETLIKELLETAVRSIRITDSDSIALELVNGQIIVKEAAEE